MQIVPSYKDVNIKTKSYNTSAQMAQIICDFGRIILEKYFSIMQPESISSSSTVKCPICKRELILITDPESGDNICNKCGMIMSDKIEDMINQLEGYNLYSISGITKDGRQTIGTSTSFALHDMGLSTTIGKTNRDASG